MDRSETTAPGIFEQKMESIELLESINRLPVQQRNVLILKYVLDLSAGEVADHMGLSPATVRSHLRHAKTSLAEMLDLRRSEQ
ncbi:hypothetical protein ADK35_43735 [Streptomyces viridochromogenes]|nr:hypothetical protein ADK35_43735 [Streptomyces viridochromogenes]KOG12814.1 hypothetical protein ADK36_34755 [Streptomyces viridochromogenes]